MPKVPKIVPPISDKRAPSPLIAWIRDFYLAVKRSPKTPAPGIPGPDGQAEYLPHNRWPDSQASRSIEPAMAQGGVHHKLADNYYHARDARRAVIPPIPIYKAGLHGEAEWRKAIGEPISEDKVEQEIRGVNKGPIENYGLKSAVPTPGFGYEWKRSIDNEEYSQQKDPEFAKLEKFDKYLKKA